MLSQNNSLSPRNGQRLSAPDRALETLVAIQKQLLHCPSIPTAYQTTLDLLNETTQVSRVAIVEASYQNACHLSNCWESEWWVGEPPSRRKRRAGKVSSIFHTLSPVWLETLAQGEIIEGTTQNLPLLERELLQRQGISAILIVPIRVDRRLYGAIRFENAQDCRDWTASERSLLEGVALALSLKLEQLLTATEMSRADQLQEDCVAAVSHELRSPLAHIQMIAQLLEVSLQQEGVLNDPASQVSAHLQMLQDECQRKNSMINDLLALSRLDSSPDFAPTAIPLQTWIPYIAETFSVRFQQRRQQLTIDIPTNLRALTTDLCILERILTELLHNACKYTPAQGAITLSACYCGNDLTGDLCLMISNTGVEILSSDLPRIFEKFYRLPSLDIWADGGTGLGLPLVKKLVEQVGATIQVSSANQKVTFVLRFPFSLQP